MVLDVVPGPNGRPQLRRVSGDKEHPANGGRLCTKGATSADMLAAATPGRLATARTHATRGAAPQDVPVDEAITTVGHRLRAIVDEHGPDAVALYVSGQLTLEAQYLANKLAKGFIGTNQIESNSRLCMASAGSGYKLSLGADGPPGSYDDFDHADAFLVIGANMADCHPILFLRMMERVRAGAKLIVVDPRRTATAAKADLFLQVRPGTDLALLNGLLHLLVAGGHVDDGFVAEHTEGWAAMEPFLADYSPGAVAELTGLAEHDLRRAADWLGAARGTWMSCWTMGLNQSTHGTWNTNALVNLHLATGAICRPGAGPFSLTGQPNAMGGREMGYMGPGLPGQRSVLVEADRSFVEQQWGLPPGRLRTDVGRGTVEMFQKMADGEIRACWIICTNPVASVGNRSTVLAGLAAAELVISQDAFAETETNAHADVLLPAAMWAETDGIMINSERNLTLTRQVVDPPGEARADWQLIAGVATAMGYGAAFTYADAEEIFTEIRAFHNPQTGYDLRGVSYDRLRAGPVQWPAAPGAGPRNPIRYRNDGVSQPLLVHPDGTRPRLVFPTPSGRAVFHPRPHLPAAELPDDDHPFLLNTGRVAHQWHTMTKTGTVAKLNRLNAGPFVEIHPSDAAALVVHDGDRVRIASRRGQAVLPAVVTDRVLPGSCFAPFHWNDVFGADLAINAVTSDAVDPISFQPELKVAAVSLTRVDVTPPAPTSPSDGSTEHVGTPAGGSAEHLGDPARPGTPTGPADGFARPSPAGTGRADHRLALLAALGTTFDLDPAPPSLTDPQRHYLAGFLAAQAALATTTTGAPTDGTPTALRIPAGAPFDAATGQWLDGFLAGGATASAPSPVRQPTTPSTTGSSGAEPGPEPRTRVVQVLWASQTGNAEEAAATVRERLAQAGWQARLREMSTPAADILRDPGDLLVVTSTFGDGDPPDNGCGLWDDLNAEDAARLLEGRRFAVAALGDSSYADFCGHGRRLDERLGALGGDRLLPRVECEPDYADALGAWLDDVLTALAASPAASGSAPSDHAGVQVTARPQPAALPRPRTSGESPAPSRTDPLSAPLIGNRLLSGDGSTKEVRRFTFDVAAERLDFAVGDALGVWPVNCAELVDEWLALTGLDPSTSVTLDTGAAAANGTGGFAGRQGPSPHESMPLHSALRYHFDLTSVRADLLRFVAERGTPGSTDEAGDRTQLRALVRADRRADLAAWAWGRQLVDVLAQYPVRADARQWLAVLPRLRPRLYSISSSPLVDPTSVSVTVSVVRFTGQRGRVRKGVCSTFLADAAPGTPVDVFVQRSPHFRPPADNTTPMIMIGPGTGVAPFLGFLQERQARGACGRSWLFFGERHRATDFHYAEELTALVGAGTLTRLDTAFSRDQDTRVHVQDRMREHGAQLWSWLADGAHLYVCGDATRMARDVDTALREIATTHGNLTPEGAAAHLRALAAQHRYVRDVY
ncbi:bifunctional nitrate reductase/sulfite reductase flavoprotein subunit alpha [Frankia sp. R82]|uniref:molybdopterin-dependent oxidoreductase n=1 Tax=Frankia sp. R82 TaxID=2950553 RepID=UPI00204422AE|nr:bifunctional nitrate reductase/sulfite reductase flavoprotein subunit alpha [Frankia sp. R82]